MVSLLFLINTYGMFFQLSLIGCHQSYCYDRLAAVLSLKSDKYRRSAEMDE